jgi:hypothetical protein
MSNKINNRPAEIARCLIGLCIIAITLISAVPSGALEFPYEENFEGVTPGFDITSGSGWGIVGEHDKWGTFSGNFHLDNNVSGADLQSCVDTVTNLRAVMNQHLIIPAASNLPALSYWYNADLDVGDQIIVDIHYIENVAGQPEERVDNIKTYTHLDNTGDFHVWEKFPIDIYKGKEVWIAFRQVINNPGSGKVFVVDEMRISDLPSEDTDIDGIPDMYDPTPNNELLQAIPDFNAVNFNDLEMTLGWTVVENQSLMMGYRIYRRENGETAEVMLNQGNLLNVDRTSYIDSTVEGTIKYYYRIVAVSKEGREGEIGTAVSATALAYPIASMYRPSRRLSVDPVTSGLTVH